jgi:hypothetical protein
VADNPQETVRELRELVIAYVKQEAVDPIKGMGKYVGFGVGGSLLLGFAAVCLEIGLLRLLQDEWLASWTDTNWSWVAYVIVVVISAAVAALVWYARGRKKAKQA